MLTEQDIQRLEKMEESKITDYLSNRIPELSSVISEEVKKAKDKFEIKN